MSQLAVMAKLSMAGIWGASAFFIAILLIVLRLRARYNAAVAEQTRYREMVDNLAEGFYRTSVDGKVLLSNPSLVKMNGYESEAELLASVNDIGAEWYVDSSRRDDFRAILDRNGHVRDFVSEIYRHKTRERIWVSENARLVRDKRSGKVLYYEGSVRHVTDTVRRSKLEEQIAKLTENLPGGLFQLVRKPDGAYDCPYFNQGFRTVVGLTREDLGVNPTQYLKRIHQADRKRYVESLEASRRDLTPWSCEFRYHRDDGDPVWLLVNGTPELSHSGEIVWHGHLSDVTQRKDAEERVHSLAYFDPLTDLPNRRAFIKQLSQTVAACRRRSEFAAVLFIDLDNFKTLNDTQGHEMGDELLRAVAARLLLCVRATDMVSRFGGDEFVLVLEGLGSERGAAVANATGACNKIIREFARGFELTNIQHITTPSIGVVVFDGIEQTPNDIIKSADIAMYEAKKGGRNNFVLFDPASLENLSEAYALQRELTHAVIKGQLLFEFQPQVDSTGTIIGAEALLRWRHPARGLLAPNSFMPMAEMTGQITQINEWVVSTAIDTLSQWRAKPGMAGLFLSVNVSAQQFCAPSFVAELNERLAHAEVDSRLLTLELTEQVMAREPDAVAHRMEELKALGIRFSLDDFGTGYSSLSQLNRFPFDEVKIDGAFVSDIEHHAANRTLIEAILGMAQALELDTVAEHVGSRFQMEFLTARGCTRFQGFYHYPPLSDAALVRLMTREGARTPLKLAAG